MPMLPLGQRIQYGGQKGSCSFMISSNVLTCNKIFLKFCAVIYKKSSELGIEYKVMISRDKEATAVQRLTSET